MRKRKSHIMVEHFVLTRFNLAINFECGKRSDSLVPTKEPWLDEEYLWKRFEVFEKYTVPSLKNQTDSEFKWIVMFHEKTPEKYIKRIEKLMSEMRQFYPIFLSDIECNNIGETITRIIEKMNCSNRAVITTRIDNDDAVHVSFIQRIKENCFGAENNTVISFVNGIQYQIKTREILNYHYVNNHFLSLYVRGGREHIMLYNHAFIDTNENIILKKVESDIPLWVEIITTNNYSNAMRWRLNNVFVDYRLLHEYSQLELKWNNRYEHLWCEFLGFFKVFWYRGKGALKLIFKYFSK